MSILDRGLSFTINHLFLPPELPQEYDGLADDERALIVSITDSANAFYDAIQHSPDNIDDSVVDQWLRVQRMLKNFSLLTRGSQEPMDSELLQRTMSSMDDGDVLALLIGAQNAGAIVRKTAGSGLTFESFRAVLPNDVVVNTQGKVQVEYPQTPRLPIPADAEAHKVLCNYLCDFSTLVFSDAFPQSTKAETTQDEHREPPHAWYITELLVDVLRGCSPHLREDELPATDYITKRVDDHVLWKDALMPWRRSPILLVMKVALQTTLLRVPDQIGYKAFMVFALSRVLREAQEAGAPDDLLWRMNAKLARRLYKLRHTNIERFPISIAAAQCGRTARLLRDNWAAVQAAEARPIDLRPPSPSAIEAAQVFSLEHSRSYLDRVQNRDKHEPQSMSDTLARFEATLPKRSRVNGRSPPEPFDAKAPLPELLDALCDIATWLGSAQHDHWLQVADTEAFCSTLGRLLDDTMEALKRFRSPSDSANPELFSLTFLNIMDLWMLLDQAAVRALPLLAQYSPELTIAPLQALLLPDASQMQRLSRIEQYITERHVNGAAGGSVFALNSAGNCSALFSARYAQANNSMRELRDRISAKAEHERSNVLRLRRERCDEHARLLQEASGLSCAYQRVGSKYPPHFGPCAKCDRESQAKHLETPIFEAPLPDNHDLANLVIFELAAPPLFTSWRASTYKLIKHFSSIPDVDRPAHDAKTDIKRYTSYINRDIFDGLSLRYDGAILLASDRESFLTTHFRRRAVPCIDRDVIKPHGPRYHFYDVEDGCYIPSTLPEMDIRAHCTYTLPTGAYSALAWCLRATTHTSNEVIACQSERPSELTYHEYEAFGHLRAGARLQWRNIVLCMETGALRLSDPSVHFLVRQAAFQAEAPTADGALFREAHADMADEEFGRQLLDVLRRCLHLTCTNWQESWTALSLSVLARRLNQLLPAGSDVRAKVKVFLRHELRPIILTWMRELSVIVSAKDDATDDLQHRLIQVCLTGKDTFYDDDDVLSADATAQAEALPDFLECTFILHRYVSHQPSSLPDGLRTLVEVDALRAVSSVTNLIGALQSEPNLIDVALSRGVWNRFHRDMRVPWSCADTAPEWLSCSTLSEGQHIRTATVHVNVLSGAILVNGMSSDVLPEEISAHPLYSHIFPRQRRMHIQPSRMLGMTYESRASFDVYEVHFHEDGPDLIIRTRDRQGVVSEFIPSSKLARDVPDDILRRHIALYRVGSAQVDFVPRDERSGWDPSAAVAWTLQHISSSPTLTSATSPPEQTTIVVCPHSDVTRNVARIFAPLEKLQEHFMITRSANSSLTVCLPRYRLVFVACNQGFTCKQFPSYIVSSTQSVGTLYGVDKLVLESPAQLAQKRVLVPAGKGIAVSTKEGHTITSITAPACDTPGVELHIFDVDPCIGRLKTDGSLTGWLMLAYLHAVSSCRQPDELTKERGVDIAIRMLRCAKATAFTRLCRDDVDLLNRLKDLAPIRSFYPMGLRVMETIDWHPGLPLSLHDDIFASLVQHIVKHAQRISLYDPQFSVGILSSLPQVEGENDLRTRALHRKSMWPIHHSPEQCSTDLTSLDRPYIPCDWETNRSTDGIRRNIRDLVADISLWRSRPDRLPQNVWDDFLAWKHLNFTAEATDINLDQPRSLYTLSKPQAWFSLYNLCMSSAGSGRYALMFSFALFLFRDQMSVDLSRVAAELFMHSEAAQNALRAPLPDGGLLHLSLGLDFRQNPSRNHLETTLRRFASSYRPMQHLKGFTPQEYGRALQSQLSQLIDHLLSLWPGSNQASWPMNLEERFFLFRSFSASPTARFIVQLLFDDLKRNRCLKSHVDELRDLLDTLPRRAYSTDFDEVSIPIRESAAASVLVRPGLPQLRSLMKSRSPPSVRITLFIYTTHAHIGNAIIQDGRYVHVLLSRIDADSKFAGTYLNGLADCVSALSGQSAASQQSTSSALLCALQPSSSFERILDEAGLWPALSKQNILSHLTISQRSKLTPQWRDSLVSYAQSLVEAQRERRFDCLVSSGQDCRNELATHLDRRHPQEASYYPDWLLFQLDSDVAVRELQSNIAVRMIHGHNRLMQLNMGEGKSSVIIPIASASCSNGQDIICVVVLKPLFGQMFHILSQRICGLVNRPVFYLPFNRDTPITSSSMRAVEDVLEACAKECGILLCQPEHLLSLQLMATSMQCSGVVTDEARLLIDIHQRLLRHSRYILDESDEILSVKYQLVYTDGQPGPLQDAPERWLVIQAVLDIISANVQSTARKHPDDVEIEDQGRRNECRRFGRIRILSSDACRDLLSASVTAIVHEGGIPFLHLRDLKREQLEETSQFISTYDVSMDVAQSVKVFIGDRYNSLLLLRGLFASGILSLALKEKRWRVDYGLDRGRTRLAVPYRAKDSPALRAEFGQPDVALVLTSLAYYYGGLTNQDLDVAFERLQMSDDPAVRYEDWTRDLPLPQRLRTLRGVNLEDANQRYDQVYPHLSRVKAVIDFYLAECVFPMEARRFEHKLTANAWDIARRKDRPTTGFSGTNDNQYMLPTSIEQDHSDAQSHTNALVLNHILQKENRTVVCKDLNVTGTIDEVVRGQPPVSVILDVGAQVLELENEEVARLWLERDDSKEAAAYFGSDGDLYVLTRDNRVEQLQRSHYRGQLGKVLVFLDEAHTRGTDLQLPPGTRALVTLGPKMTKDKLVQGCMRMRKLGQPGGHSIVFLANAEIQTRIRRSIKEQKSTLDSSDVLVWTLKESIRQTEEDGALWAAQGLSFDARESAWEAYNAGEIDAQGLAKALLEPEALTLEELYAPHRPPVFVETERQNDRQRAIWERCNKFGFKVSEDSRLQEEQERELAHEKEQEREVQHVPPAAPLPHATDPALMALLATGRVPTQPAFRTLHESLALTSVEALIPNVSSTFFQDTRTIAATSDFAGTTELSAHSPHDKDAFLRSVQWIVSTDKDPNTLLLISPHEANEILPRVRQSKDVHLHLYAPRVTRETRSFDDLTFFTVPSSDASTFRPPAEQIRHELNLFAGNLFVKDMAAYLSLCHFLGLHLGKLPEGGEGTVDHDGFVSSAIIRAELSMPSSQIHHSPVSVLRSLISLRRKGQGFLLTHLGRMLYGNALAAEDF
ncbi:hypothetical protein K523DRAFT_239739 [Schizophyllum commune Tattone D]|nr:hypothetical protein K523DRAFT_239739 [Schizophyllum commune Tattone D]